MSADLVLYELRRPAAPELTRRELDVLNSLCRPALSDEAFALPATAHEIAVDLVVTDPSSPPTADLTAMATFADGSHHFLRAGISEATLRALITRNGGEKVDLSELRY